MDVYGPWGLADIKGPVDIHRVCQLSFSKSWLGSDFEAILSAVKKGISFEVVFESLEGLNAWS